MSDDATEGTCQVCNGAQSIETPCAGCERDGCATCPCGGPGCTGPTQTACPECAGPHSKTIPMPAPPEGCDEADAVDAY